jgi:hypothetical protein
MYELLPVVVVMLLTGPFDTVVANLDAMARQSEYELFADSVAERKQYLDHPLVLNNTSMSLWGASDVLKTLCADKTIFFELNISLDNSCPKR